MKQLFLFCALIFLIGCTSQVPEISPQEPSEEIFACTQDAKQCQDGSFVSRNAENDCQFDACPEELLIDEQQEPEKPKVRVSNIHGLTTIYRGSYLVNVLIIDIENLSASNETLNGLGVTIYTNYVNETTVYDKVVNCSRLATILKHRKNYFGVITEDVPDIVRDPTKLQLCVAPPQDLREFAESSRMQVFYQGQKIYDNELRVPPNLQDRLITFQKPFE